MSAQAMPEHVCYVHCNFCNTILVVSVPSNCLFNLVTVRCGHCANLLSVNMEALLQTHHPQDPQNDNLGFEDLSMGRGSSSNCNRMSMMDSMSNYNQKMVPIPSPMKRQRIPSAYNKFIKEEIRRLKATEPNISHREAFSAAAKNVL